MSAELRVVSNEMSVQPFVWWNKDNEDDNDDEEELRKSNKRTKDSHLREQCLHKTLALRLLKCSNSHSGRWLAWIASVFVICFRILSSSLNLTHSVSLRISCDSWIWRKLIQRILSFVVFELEKKETRKLEYMCAICYSILVQQHSFRPLCS